MACQIETIFLGILKPIFTARSKYHNLVGNRYHHGFEALSSFLFDFGWYDLVWNVIGICLSFKIDWCLNHLQYVGLYLSVNLKVLTKNNRFHMVWNLQFYQHQLCFMINTFGGSTLVRFLSKIIVLSHWYYRTEKKSWYCLICSRFVKFWKRRYMAYLWMDSPFFDY